MLMVHGTGGGFDQGLAFAEPLVATGRQVIAPSRFGYLRSAFPDEPTSENQSDAFVEFLDPLGIDRVPIIAARPARSRRLPSPSAIRTAAPRSSRWCPPPSRRTACRLGRRMRSRRR